MSWQDDELVQPAASPSGWQADEVVRPAAAPEASSSVPMSAVAGGNRGIAGVVGLPVDTLLNVADLGLAGVGALIGSLGAPADALPELIDRRNVVGSSEFLSDLLNRGGIATTPQGDGLPNRLAFATGAGAVGGLMAPQNALSGAIRGGIGGLAGQGAFEATGSPEAAVVGAILGGASPEAVKATIRGAIRGASPEAMQNALASFGRVGVSPSVGQATESRFWRGVESGLAGTPGAAGVMTRAAENQQRGIGAGVDEIASSVAPKGSATTAGMKISEGIKGDKGFVNSFKKTQNELYDRLDSHIDSQTPIDVGNTQKALAALNAEIPNAPALSQWFKNAKIAGIEGALEADATRGRSYSPSQLKSAAEKVQGGAKLGDALNEGRLPYEALKKLRTLVGEQISDSSLLSDVPRSKWKTLYGAISDDLKAAANAAGPEATKAFNRANDFTSAGYKRIELLDSVVERAGGPEKIFAAATSGTGEGATTLRAVMKSLPPEGQQALTSTVLRRLGRATPGKQNDVGDAFSTETFLTNWAKLSPEAKQTLIGPFGSKLKADIDALANVANNLREGSKVFANPSGTAGKTAAISTGVTAAAALGAGNLPLAGSIASGVVGANLLARVANNKSFVNALARSTEVSPNLLTSQILNMSRLPQQRPDR